jgi:small GTP-binding protein
MSGNRRSSTAFSARGRRSWTMCPGVTRDRNYADSTYRNRRFRLVDTGGLDPTASEGMLSLIRQQSQLAIAEADILVLVLDARSGLTPADEEVVQTLRGSDKPVYYVINKIDTPKADPLVADFYRLGQEQLYPLSAEHGIGVAELLDDLFSSHGRAPRRRSHERHAPHRHRRASECRQIHLGQFSPRRSARRRE